MRFESSVPRGCHHVVQLTEIFLSQNVRYFKQPISIEKMQVFVQFFTNKIVDVTKCLHNSSDLFGQFCRLKYLPSYYRQRQSYLSYFRKTFSQSGRSIRQATSFVHPLPKSIQTNQNNLFSRGGDKRFHKIAKFFNHCILKFQKHRHDDWAW